MTETIRSDQCGVCMETGAQRTEPRLLPCTHVLCTPCLRSDQARVSNHRCPVCRLEYDIPSIEELPFADIAGSDNTTSEPAIVSDINKCSTCATSDSRSALEDAPPDNLQHCAQCKRSFCDSHIRLHRQLLSDHITTSLAEYRARTPVQTFCRKHPQYLLIVGCSLCRELSCNLCMIINPNYCFKSAIAGMQHKYVVVQEIIAETRAGLRDGISKLERKSSQYTETMNQAQTLADKLKADFAEDVGKIEQARDAMMEKVRIDYESLKSQLERDHSGLTSEIKDYKDVVKMQKEALDLVTGNLKKHAEECTEEELMYQISDITAKVDDLLSYTLPPLNCTSATTVLSTISDIQSIALPVDLISVDIDVESQGLSLLTHSTSDTTLSSTESATSAAILSAPPLNAVDDSYSPPAPSSILIHKSSVLFKSGEAIPPERYCVAKGHLYALRNRQLQMIVDPFGEPGYIEYYEESGKYIVAHREKLYTRLINSAVEDLVNIYALDADGSAYPPDSRHRLQNTLQQQLLPSFAVQDNNIIFCQSIASPKLLIFPLEPGRKEEVSIQFSRNTRVHPVSKHLCTSISSGPPGYVILLCAQYRDFGDPLELLLLVKIDDGSTKWVYNCQRTLEFTHDFYKLPQPILYKNGYIFFMHDKTTIHVLDAKTGERKSTLSTPVKSQIGFKLSIKSVQMTSYSDDDLMIISNVVKRNTKNDRSENMIMSTLWRIQYDGRL